MNNTSMFTADRMTHLKIVVVSLVFATLIAGIGMASRVSDTATAGNGRLEATGPIKVGKPVTAGKSETTSVR